MRDGRPSEWKAGIGGVYSVSGMPAAASLAGSLEPMLDHGAMTDVTSIVSAARRVSDAATGDWIKSSKPTAASGQGGHLGPERAVRAAARVLCISVRAEPAYGRSAPILAPQLKSSLAEFPRARRLSESGPPGL